MARDRRPVAGPDPLTARLAVAYSTLLPLVLRPVEPMTARDFDAIVIAIAVLLAVAERRRATP
jgi:hypothetical protein